MVRPASLDTFFKEHALNQTLYSNNKERNARLRLLILRCLLFLTIKMTDWQQIKAATEQLHCSLLLVSVQPKIVEFMEMNP